MAVYRASLLGKCLNRRASETPAASASSRVVVPWKPLSANTVRTARTIAARRSSLDNRVDVFRMAVLPCGEYRLTERRGQGGGRTMSGSCEADGVAAAERAAALAGATTTLGRKRRASKRPWG